MLALLLKQGPYMTDLKCFSNFFFNHSSTELLNFKGCVYYIFASLFFKSKLEHLSNCERCFLFLFKSSFHSQENQILEFYILKFDDIIKCLSIKQEIHFTE